MNSDRPPIPTYWSGEQALEVVDFLDQLINCIWWIHGKKMTRAAQFPPGQYINDMDSEKDSLPGRAPPEAPFPDIF